MRRYHPWLFGLFSCTLVVACQQSAVSDDEQLYHQKAAEVTTFFLKNTPDCHCIMEPSRESLVRITHSDQPEQDTLSYRKRMMQRLGITQPSALDRMIALSTTYDIYKAVSDAPVKIFSRQPMDTIQSPKTFRLWMDSLSQQCPEGIYYVNKPIFNENFNRVSFEIGLGGGCFPSDPMILEYREDGWFCEDCLW